MYQSSAGYTVCDTYGIIAERLIHLLSSLACGTTLAPALDDYRWTILQHMDAPLKQLKTDIRFDVGDVIACKLAILSHNADRLRLLEIQAYGISESSLSLSQ